MGMNKAKGNMYEFVTHVHTHLGGECPHRCCYCSTQVMAERFSISKYKGPVRLIDEEFKTQYGTGKTIFIEHCNDMFADGVTDDMIAKILGHCNLWPENEYVFQTKNPERVIPFLSDGLFPPEFILGTTLETDRNVPGVSLAPNTYNRKEAMRLLAEKRFVKTFVTIEPIMDFDPDIFIGWVIDCGPLFVNIGADSKNRAVAEPPRWKVEKLIAALNDANIEIRQKRNLERLLAKDGV